MKHIPESRDPAELRPHSILNHIPAPEKDAPEVCACADAIREQDGHLLPLVIDETNQILTDDSRLRWMAAKRMGMEVVFVTVQPGALAPVIALNAIMHRSHWTKSAIAYLAIPLLKPAFEAARAQRMEILKNHGTTPTNLIGHSVTYALTWEQMSEKVGVSKGLFVAAKQVRAEFDKDKTKYPFEVEGGAQDGEIVEQTLREHFEPKILRQQVDCEHQAHRPIGLGGVMKAIRSILKYRALDGRRPEPEQLELFKRGIKELGFRFTYWNEFNAEEKRQLEPVLDAFFDLMPVDFLERSHEKIKERLKASRRGE